MTNSWCDTLGIDVPDLESVKGQYVEWFEPCMLDQHGGDLNGFVMIRGERDKLHELTYQNDWKNWMTKAYYNLEGFVVTRAFFDDMIKDNMGRLQKVVK